MAVSTGGVCAGDAAPANTRPPIDGRVGDGSGGGGGGRGRVVVVVLALILTGWVQVH